MASKKQNRLLEGIFAGPAKTYARKVATRKLNRSGSAKPQSLHKKIGDQFMRGH